MDEWKAGNVVWVQHALRALMNIWATTLGQLQSSVLEKYCMQPSSKVAYNAH